MSPQIIFGTASFGMDQTEFQDAASVSSVLQVLGKLGVRRLDSAARYPPLNPGQSERLIGEGGQGDNDFLIDTKVYTDTKTDGSGDLTEEAIENSVSSSLARLQRESKGVNILHIHRADPSTPVVQQVRAFNKQIEKGRCKGWGVSNTPIPMLEEMLRICDEQNLVKPTCYQGEYNIMTRGAERQLLPLLRKHGVAFSAFRASAAGFLTGNFANGDLAGTRFDKDNPLGKYFQNLFSAEDLHAAFRIFNDAVTKHGLTTFEVSIRWIFYHSALKEQDGVVLGASKQRQIEETVAMVGKGPLPAEVVQVASQLWEAVSESRSQIL